MFSVSVIICSHNPREDYLRRTLEGLKAQTLPLTDWELLVVDNASKEPLAGRFDLSWHPNARFLQESKTGKTHALLRGIGEAKGDLMMTVDDDNVLRPDYLQTTLKISADYPWLGAWGGSCIAEFESTPPDELRPWLYGLMIEKLDVSIWAKLPTGGPALPPGAGMAFRRNVAMRYREQVLHDPVRQALDRSGKMLSSGGDSDLALCGFALDLGAGRFPELELTHLISAKRLTIEYLEALFEGAGYGGTVLVAIHDRERQFPGQLGSGMLRILLLRIAMLIAGKGRVERQIRLAEERGRLAARRDLQRMGYFERQDKGAEKGTGK
jgi:glycosyltransferase involved in cell wall biosynthesis